MIFTYFVPIIVMGYTYTRVGIELWGSQSIGEATQRQLENIKSKRRVSEAPFPGYPVGYLQHYRLNKYGIRVGESPVSLLHH